MGCCRSDGDGRGTLLSATPRRFGADADPMLSGITVRQRPGVVHPRARPFFRRLHQGHTRVGIEGTALLPDSHLESLVCRVRDVTPRARTHPTRGD